MKQEAGTPRDSAPPTPAPPPVAVRRERPIRLAISGSDLLMRGRFDHWVPLVSDESEASDGAVQILFDVTGMAPAAEADGTDLFEFASRTARPAGNHLYLAKGTMRAGDVAGEAVAALQTPREHTPFMAVTFSVDRRAFPELWSALGTDLAGRPAAEAADFLPRAWPLPPTLAAA